MATATASPKNRLAFKPPKTAAPSRPKILLFGRPGVGKTWTALDFPNVAYMDTEGGADLQHYTDKLEASGGQYLGPNDGTLDPSFVLGQIRALATEKHEFKTLVIDSISKLYNNIIALEAEKLGDKDAFGASKKPAIAFMRSLVSWVNRLDMNVLFIAHEKATWVDDKQGPPTFDCWEKLEYELHLALHAQKRGNSRVAVVKKSRLTGFPELESFDLAYSEFARRYGKDVIEAEVHTLKLASESQLDEIRKLVTKLKITEDGINKALAKRGVENLEDLEASAAEEVIATLKKQAEHAL